MQWKLPLFKIYQDEEDMQAIEKVVRRGSFWAEGPEIRQFEKALEQYTGSKHITAFNSGTSALHSALLVLGVKGKQVIVPSFTFISTASAVVAAGGIPVFAEVEEETYGLDAEDVERRITGKTRAILPVHYGGVAARDICRLKQLADEKGLLLVEDAAESLGAKKGGKMAGTFGNAGMHSFCQNKVIATGEGGAIATEDDQVFKRLGLIRSHGRQGDNYFSSNCQEDYKEIGYNYRLPTMLAALGLSQLGKVDKIIGMRRKNAELLSKKLAGISGIKTPKELKGSFNVYQLYTIELEDCKKRDALQRHLAEKGIMTKVYFQPVHLKTAYRKGFGCREGDLPLTESLAKRVLSLPFYPHMTGSDIELLVDSIKSFFRRD